MQLTGQAMLAGLAQLLVRGGLIIAFLLFARTFAQADFAALGYFNIGVIAMIGIASMGGAAIATKYFSIANADPRDRRRTGALLLLIAFAAIVSALAALALPGSLFGGVAKALIFATILLGVLGSGAAGALVGRQEFSRLAINAAIAATIILGLAFVGGREQNFSWAALAVATAYAGKGLFDVLTIARHIDAEWPDRSAWRETIFAVSAMAGSSAVWAAGMWAIATAIKSSLGDGPFAIYVVGIQWYAIGMFVAANLTRVLLPRQVRAAREGRRAAIVGPAMILAMASAAALAAFAYVAKPLVDLAYGPSLAGLGEILWLFIAASITVAPANLLSNQLIAEGREVRWFYAALAWAAVLAVTVPVALGVGLEAVLFSLVAANLAMVAVAIFFLQRGKKPCPA